MLKVLACSLMVLLCLKGIECISEDERKLVEKIHKTCVDETGIAEATIEEGRKGNFLVDGNVFKCYLKCIWQNMDALNDDGSVNAEATLDFLPDEISNKIASTARACGSLVGVDACDSVFLANKCFFEMNPQEYFII